MRSVVNLVFKDNIKSLKLIVLLLLFHFTVKSRMIPYTYREQIKNASEIFIGKVIAIETVRLDSTKGIGIKTTAKILKIHSWKGEIQDTMTFTDVQMIPCCQSRWKKDETFLIYTIHNNVNFCKGRTSTLENNKDILRLNLKYFKYRYKGKT